MKYIKNTIVAGFVGCILVFIIEYLGLKLFGVTAHLPADIPTFIKLFLSGCVIYSVIHFNFWLFRNDKVFAILGSIMGLMVVALACSIGIPLLTLPATSATVILTIIIYTYTFIFVL